jgi:hypothetical protein
MPLRRPQSSGYCAAFFPLRCSFSEPRRVVHARFLPRRKTRADCVEETLRDALRSVSFPGRLGEQSAVGDVTMVYFFSRLNYIHVNLFCSVPFNGGQNP